MSCHGGRGPIWGPGPFYGDEPAWPTRRQRRPLLLHLLLLPAYLAIWGFAIGASLLVLVLLWAIAWNVVFRPLIVQPILSVFGIQL